MDYAIVLSVIAGALIIYYYVFQDWFVFKKYGIPYKTLFPLVGNSGSMVFCGESMTELLKSMYDLSSDAKYVGMYKMTKSAIVLRDPELIKSIAFKHFDMFMDRHTVDSEDSIFGKTLFALRGDKWREVRSILGPAFMSSKMKNIFQSMSDHASDFVNFLMTLLTLEDRKATEMKGIFMRYTNDVTAICLLGVSVDSLRTPSNKFYAYATKAISANIIAFVKLTLLNLPLLARIIKLTIIREEVANFFLYLISTTIKIRDKNSIFRPDMLQLMMENRGKDSKTELTIDDMVAHAFIFIYDNIVNSSQLMCFAAHEIAINQDVQERLQNEIDEVLEKTNGRTSYEAINSMKYLDAVINEALRKYPIGLIDRVCLKDFQLPPTLPGKKPFTIKKGQAIFIPVYGLHHDPQYFEEPEKFNPERFLGEKKEQTLNSGAYLPFGLGPRMCIGARFALLETKILFFHLLARCDLKPREKISILSKKDFYLRKKSFWLNVSPRKNPHRTIVINRRQWQATALM